MDNLMKRLEVAEQERDHWRANHDNMVARLRIATERLDLPLERIRAIHELTSSQELLAESRQHVATLQSTIKFLRDSDSRAGEQLEKLIELLTQIADVANGPAPDNVSWSWDDLVEKLQLLTRAAFDRTEINDIETARTIIARQEIRITELETLVVGLTELKLP